MREIKFRAWDKYEERMIYSGTEQNDYPFSWMIHNNGIEIAEHDGTDWNYLKGLAFMQYTGFKDKNGVETYESDVCDTHTRWGKGIVAFERGIFKVRGISLCTFTPGIEVIGNIYENPELLGGDSI